MNLRNNEADSYRLTATELNKLILEGLKIIPDIKINEKNMIFQYQDYDKQIKYYEISRDCYETKFLLFEMVKDHEDPEVESQLFSLKEILIKFQSNFDSKTIILLPVFECLKFANIASMFWQAPQRKHAVLVEVNLSTRRLQVHDSQGLLINSAYRDNFSELQDSCGLKYDRITDYHAYGTQNGLDRVSCGYFVCGFTWTIIHTGHSENCKDFQFDIRASYDNKWQYLAVFGLCGLSEKDCYTWDFVQQNIEIDEGKNIITIPINKNNEVEEGWLFLDEENEEKKPKVGLTSFFQI